MKQTETCSPTVILFVERLRVHLCPEKKFVPLCPEKKFVPLCPEKKFVVKTFVVKSQSNHIDQLLDVLENKNRRVAPILRDIAEQVQLRHSNNGLNSSQF
ncbi:MAG: hypothetical protein AAFR12_19735 [Cyanobacteria bacterium J06626_6]